MSRQFKAKPEVPAAISRRQRRKSGLTKLVDEWAGMALSQRVAETRFHVRAARGDRKRGLALLDKLDRMFVSENAARKRRKLKA